MQTFNLKTFPLSQKKIFLRTDFNVPIKRNKIANNSKIKATLPTIRFLLQKDCKIIIGTHLGRPQGTSTPSVKTNIIAEELQKLLPSVKIIALNDCIGSNVRKRINDLKEKEIIVLENLRFYREEEQNDQLFAQSLAAVADVYVNDAFGVAHRKHASIHAITRYLPSLPGFLLEREVHHLSKVLHPKKPSVWILGGAKLNKIKLIEQAIKTADYILVGGALAFSFLKAKKIPIGMSKIDHYSTSFAKQILSKKKMAQRIILPKDFVVAEKISARAKTQIVPFNGIKNNQLGLDLGPKTVEEFKQYLRKAHTIVWNGPLGYFEFVQFSRATKDIGRFIGKLTATTVVGGGETAEAMHAFHLDHLMTHVSTGGGAALAFLAGEKMPGIEALEKNYQTFRKKVF